MFCYVLLLMTTLSVVTVLGQEGEEAMKAKKHLKEKAKVEFSKFRAQELMNSRGELGSMKSQRRRQECVCGNVSSNKSCFYCVTDGCDCGYICCNKHSYCNWTDNTCGCCEGTNAGSLGHDDTTSKVLSYMTAS